MRARGEQVGDPWGGLDDLFEVVQHQQELAWMHVRDEPFRQRPAALVA